MKDDLYTIFLGNKPLIIAALVVVILYFSLLFGLMIHVQLNKKTEARKRHERIRQKIAQRQQPRQWFFFSDNQACACYGYGTEQEARAKAKLFGCGFSPLRNQRLVERLEALRNNEAALNDPLMCLVVLPGEAEC